MHYKVPKSVLSSLHVILKQKLPKFSEKGKFPYYYYY